MSQSDLQPTSFLTLEPGTSVVDRFGQPVGAVERVLLLDGGGFDGIVVDTPAGRRFVDAPEVRRISRGAGTLGVTTADVQSPGADGPRVYGIPEARFGRVHATEADRDEVIDSLKRAFVEDQLTTEEPGERVSITHLAETLDQLDAASADRAHRHNHQDPAGGAGSSGRRGDDASGRPAGPCVVSPTGTARSHRL